MSRLKGLAITVYSGSILEQCPGDASSRLYSAALYLGRKTSSTSLICERALSQCNLINMLIRTVIYVLVLEQLMHQSIDCHLLHLLHLKFQKRPA
jgi:hypothetical protein